jgi:hypothetical protein
MAKIKNGCCCDSEAPKIDFGKNVFLENPASVRIFKNDEVDNKNGDRGGIAWSENVPKRLYPLPSIDKYLNDEEN